VTGIQADTAAAGPLVTGIQADTAAAGPLVTGIQADTAAAGPLVTDIQADAAASVPMAHTPCLDAADVRTSRRRFMSERMTLTEGNTMPSPNSLHSAREPIDASAYVQVPQWDVPATVAVVVRLLVIAPRAPTPPVRQAAGKLRSTVVRLQGRWAQRDAQAAPPLRPLDLTLDNCWSGLFARLSSFASIAEVAPAEAARAAAIVATLFPNRLDFTRLEIPSQWAESEKRLRRIDGEGLARDIEKLAGAWFIDGLRQSHAALGRALGLVEGAAPTSDDVAINLSEDLRATHRALAAYMLQLVAADEAADDDLAADIRRALAAFDAARPERRGSAVAPEDVVTPTTPVPELPPA
jgi:hypothetical protein